MNNNRKIILVVFVLVAIVQLYVPASMIWEREDVLGTGKDFRFKVAPIDPNDPFRGKYITLQFDQRSLAVEKGYEWTNGETVYVLLSEDSSGMVKFTSALREKPSGQSDYLKTVVWYSSNTTLYFDLPFNRFYMEESKAYDAELAYNESLTDSTQNAYALVKIKDGEAVLKDVFLNEESISDVVRARQRMREE